MGTVDGLISVAIPVFNCERYLAEAIESVLAQTRAPGEIIIVDDGSTDESAAIAMRFGPPVRYAFQPNSGAPAARNRGAELARGEFLSFLDADDTWVPRKLELQMACLEEDSQLDLVNGHVVAYISPDLGEDSRRRIRCPQGALPAPGPATMLIRSDAFFRVGLFDTACSVGESIDWYAKAMDLRLRSVMLPEVVARRRLHRDNISYLDRDARREYLRVVRESLARRRRAREGEGSADSRSGKA